MAKKRKRYKYYERARKIFRNEENLRKLRGTEERYNLVGSSLNTLKNIKGGRNKYQYVRRLESMISGNYERKRRSQYRENYIKAMEKNGLTSELVDLAKKVLRGKDIDTLSQILPMINTYYPHKYENSRDFIVRTSSLEEQLEDILLNYKDYVKKG